VSARHGPTQTEPDQRPPNASTTTESSWAPKRLPSGTKFTVDGVGGATNWNDVLGIQIKGLFGRRLRVTVEVLDE